jgi:hypothetical protein
MVRSSHNEPNKITRLGIWVDKALDQSLTNHNIKLMFKIIWIWHFNPKPVDGRVQCWEFTQQQIIMRKMKMITYKMLELIINENEGRKIPIQIYFI